VGVIRSHAPGTNTIVLVGSSPSGSPGIQNRAAAAGTTCTFTGFGPSPEQLEPVDPPARARRVPAAGSALLERGTEDPLVMAST